MSDLSLKDLSKKIYALKGINLHDANLNSNKRGLKINTNNLSKLRFVLKSY